MAAGEGGRPGRVGRQRWHSAGRIPFCITKRYACPMAQVVARLDDALLAAIDDMVKEGEFASRSDAIRVALQQVTDERRRRKIGEAIIEGYRRIPETEEELARVDELTRRMIEEEPW